MGVIHSYALSIGEVHSAESEPNSWTMLPVFSCEYSSLPDLSFLTRQVSGLVRQIARSNRKECLNRDFCAFAKSASSTLRPFQSPFSLTARGGREHESAALISASSLSIALSLSSTFMRPLAGSLKN